MTKPPTGGLSLRQPWNRVQLMAVLSALSMDLHALGVRPHQGPSVITMVVWL